MKTPPFHALAKKRWPKAEWIDGEGPWALLAHCRVLTVTLWPDKAAAEKQKAFIDKTACGGFCRGELGHEILLLKLPSKPATAKK